MAVLSVILALIVIKNYTGKIRDLSDANPNYTYQYGENASEMIRNNYTNVSASYQLPKYDGESIEIPIDKAYVANGENCLTSDNYGYKNQAAALKIGSKETFSFEVPTSARYAIRFDYVSYDDSILPVEVKFEVNGEVPFYEARRVLFETTWVADEEKAYDRYNKEIVSIPNKVIQWETKYLKDASYRYSTPLEVELQQGSNQITITVAEGEFLLGNIYLEQMPEVATYQGSEVAAGKELIQIEGEDFAYRNDSSIRAVAETDANVYPLNVKDTVLNTMDSEAFKSAGQKVTYEFTVETAGYYYIAMNYCQPEKSDFPVFVDVAVDDVLPNDQFVAYPLAYTSKYKTDVMVDDNGDELSVYLEAGVHKISYQINIDHIRNVLESVDCIMGEINDLSLEVTKAAGTNKDKFRDLKITKYIPDVKDRLLGWVDALEIMREGARVYNPSVNSVASFSYARVASKQLKSLASDPDDLIYRVAELSSSINSINTQLANLLDSLNKNNVAIDRIYVFQEDAKLPMEVSFFEKLLLILQRFFYSFFNQSYSTANVNEDHLQVWVNRSRQHVEIMQKMIDEQFTPETGIHVDLCIMPDQNKLVLANAAGNSPDIATGLNYAIPFEHAIRGSIVDLTQFDDFKEVASRFSSGLLLPATVGNGIYALPETMNFWVLFYRTDVFEKLSLTVPDTIDDVMDILPELQSRGLNFYYPTAGMIAMRNFHGTTPLLFQNGASLYTDYLGESALNSEEAIQGFTTLTELFTLYNVPIDIPNFYQHFRNGDLPIGIADYAVYNLLTNAAPEIANSWEIALVPGVETEDGEVLRYTSGGAESTIMFKSNPEREAKSWEFMKWWSSSEVQTEYGQTLQITYGNEYIWTTANLDAFYNLPIDSSDKEVIAEQSKWVMEGPRVLGSYMVEREISNAFNDIVVNGKNLRTRIDKAVKSINRETERKLEEFGYIEDGKVVKEYVVPTMDVVNKILGNTN
jgi:ABC-type glycerol-3-phosphate transport system substrate-binding protein